MDFSFSFGFSVFDFIMLCLIVVGAYRGFAQGAIVQCISLFSLLAGLTICVNISKLIYETLNKAIEENSAKTNNISDLVAYLIIAVLFVGAVYGTMKISALVYRHLADLPKGLTNRVLGAVFGGMKYFFIAALYLITMLKIDKYAPFLSPNAKESRYTHASKWLMISIFPYLDMDPNKDKDKDKKDGDANPTPYAYPPDSKFQ